MKVLVAHHVQLFVIPMDRNPLDSSVDGILQASILEWVAISFSRESFQPSDRTQVSHIAGRHLNFCTIKEALKYRIQSLRKPPIETQNFTSKY